MDWLSRVRSEPVPAQAGYQQQSQYQHHLHSPVTPHTAARTRDPNAPDYKFQVNQKCIYERELPGGSYITAHIQRLQSGYYDSAIVHEDLMENVRFVAINFVFHPSRKDYRFKSAEISVALHHTKFDRLSPFERVRNSIVTEHPSEHDHATQTDTVSNALIRSSDALPIRRRGTKPTACRPKFIRHAPHLLYGSVSPETLNWNFNVAGSAGVSYGPANATFKPSYGKTGSYKVYEMMRIQGSVRTLRSWFGDEYDVEDGEIVWTLEENRLQKSGLPREFTFVMMLTKGSGGFEPSDDVTLEINIDPKVSGPLGGTYPGFVTGMHRFRPFRKEQVNLDQEIGQVFEPSIQGRGFNFANLASSFDEFVWLPGTTYSTTDNPSGQSNTTPSQQPGSQEPAKQGQQPQKQIGSPPPGDTTLNLRVFLENARGSPIPMTRGGPNQYILPGLHLKPPSRNPSPLPPSVTGSHRSKRRSITITSAAPTSTRSTHQRHSYAGPSSQFQSRQTSGATDGARQVSHTHSLRKTRSRSGLDKEYVSSESPRESRAEPQTFHDARTGVSPPAPQVIENYIAQERSGMEDTSSRYGDERQTARNQHYGDEVPEDLYHRDSIQPDGDFDHSQSQAQTPRPLQPGYSTPPLREQRFPSLADPASAIAEESNVSLPGTVQHHDTSESVPATAIDTETSPALRLASQPQFQNILQRDESLTALPETQSTPHRSAEQQEDVTTPSWHQHTSSLSPPSSGQTAPPTYESASGTDMDVAANRDLESQANPQANDGELARYHSLHAQQPNLDPKTTASTTANANANPKPDMQPLSTINPSTSTPRTSLDQTRQSTTWNDTPPEWSTPSGSGANTPTRNRSLRTRKATQRALVYQDQIAMQTYRAQTQAQTQALDGVVRGHSLNIHASPYARSRTENYNTGSDYGTGGSRTGGAQREMKEEGGLPMYAGRGITVGNAAQSSRSNSHKANTVTHTNAINTIRTSNTHNGSGNSNSGSNRNSYADRTSNPSTKKSLRYSYPATAAETDAHEYTSGRHSDVPTSTNTDTRTGDWSSVTTRPSDIASPLTSTIGGAAYTGAGHVAGAAGLRARADAVDEVDAGLGNDIADSPTLPHMHSSTHTGISTGTGAGTGTSRPNPDARHAAELAKIYGREAGYWGDEGDDTPQSQPTRQPYTQTQTQKRSVSGKNTNTGDRSRLGFSGGGGGGGGGGGAMAQALRERDRDIHTSGSGSGDGDGSLRGSYRQSTPEWRDIAGYVGF